MGNHFLLQGIFLTQALNPCFLHCRWILFHWSTMVFNSSPCLPWDSFPAVESYPPFFVLNVQRAFLLLDHFTWYLEGCFSWVWLHIRVPPCPPLLKYFLTSSAHSPTILHHTPGLLPFLALLSLSFSEFSSVDVCFLVNCQSACGSAGKESACNAGDLGWEDSPREGRGYPFQYSGPENSIQSMGLQRVGHDWANFTWLECLLLKCTSVSPRSKYWVLNICWIDEWMIEWERFLAQVYLNLKPELNLLHNIVSFNMSPEALK